MNAGGVEKVVARRLVKSFGAVMALRGVDVTLEPGLSLIEGANGSGKSTLLGVLGTSLKPTSGTVDYEPLGRDLDEVRAELGWLSHESMAYPDLTGRQNVELVAALQGLDREEAWRRAEERFGLGAFARRALRGCSRGQRQRIALARALVHEPSLVLLDEPTTGLDRDGAARLLRVVDEEIARGAIVAVVSHEPEVFRDRASARVVLERGKLSTAAKAAKVERA